LTRAALPYKVLWQADALAWLLQQAGVTGPIIGPRTVEQLDSAQRAVTLRLDDKVLQRLDTIFPGYRSAPEHYAW
jgi:aryl-alcohol dehydrogenase-like predicted oxidoreductase